MSDPKNQKSWFDLQERGTYCGLYILLWIYKIAGIKALHMVLYFVVGFYFIFSSQPRAASKKFLIRIHQYLGARSPFKKQPGLMQSFQHFMSFARMACDKIIVWKGHYTLEDVEFTGYDDYDAYQKQGQGCLLIVSHLGNIDICRAFAGNYKKMSLTVLVHNAHAPNFQKIMSGVTGEMSSIEMIEVSDITPDTMILLKEKIQAGENVAISGDRTAVESQNRFEIVDFLGHPAPFAQGPFIMAQLLDCPVFAIFTLKHGNGYKAFFHFLAPTFRTERHKRKAELKAHIQNYAKLLEKYACAYPLQWFNFYDYWNASFKDRTE